MDTVNRVYHAASHAVWGEEEAKSGEEPVSGETGKGTATDPYDAGNMEGMKCNNFLYLWNCPGWRLTKWLEQETTAEETSSSSQDNIASQKTPGSTGGSSDPKSTSERSPRPADPVAPTNATYPVAGGLVGDPSTGTGSMSKHQGAGSPFDKPSDEQVSHIRDRKSVAEGVQSPALGDDEPVSSRDTATSQKLGAQDTSTPPSNVSGRRSTGTESTAESTQKSEAELGSGEKYVKSSGFAAEGGDFDATQPGAGREADRMEHNPSLNYILTIGLANLPFPN